MYKLTLLSSLLCLLLSSLLCLLLTSCIENLGIFNGESGVLIISGNINNQPGPYSVNLSLTKKFGEGYNFQVVEGANVQVLANNGEVIDLIDKYKGNYSTPDDFQGEVGSSYQLSVTLRSGESYLSNWTEMKPTIPIDTIYYSFEERPILTEADVAVDQSTLVFWLEYQNLKNQRDYIRWRYTEDFKVMSPMATVVNNSNVDDFPGYDIGEAPYKYCYARSFDSEFVKVADDILNDGYSQKTELTYMPFSRKLDLEYSIEVYQHVISEREFDYWTALEAQLENNGSIFETSNYQIKGNLINIDNPDQMVLGYFSVSSVSSQRLFLVKGEIPYEHYYACGGERIPAWCSDCRLYSAQATLDKPSFWP